VNPGVARHHLEFRHTRGAPRAFRVLRLAPIKTQMAGSPDHDGQQSGAMTATEKRNEMSELDQTEMIETKASGDSPVITSAGAAGDDVANAFDDFMRAFESFKAENEQRIAKIEKRLPVDVLTTEKLDRINRAIDEHKSIVDELALKSARPKLGASGVYRSGAALSTKPHSRPMSAMARPTSASPRREGALGRLRSRRRLSRARRDRGRGDQRSPSRNRKALPSSPATGPTSRQGDRASPRPEIEEIGPAPIMYRDGAHRLAGRPHSMRQATPSM
jgi:hypothetical protein